MYALERARYGASIVLCRYHFTYFFHEQPTDHRIWQPLVHHWEVLNLEERTGNKDVKLAAPILDAGHTSWDARRSGHIQSILSLDETGLETSKGVKAPGGGSISLRSKLASHVANDDHGTGCAEAHQTFSTNMRVCNRTPIVIIPNVMANIVSFPASSSISSKFFFDPLLRLISPRGTTLLHRQQN